VRALSPWAQGRGRGGVTGPLQHEAEVGGKDTGLAHDTSVVLS